MHRCDLERFGQEYKIIVSAYPDTDKVLEEKGVPTEEAIETGEINPTLPVEVLLDYPEPETEIHTAQNTSDDQIELEAEGFFIADSRNGNEIAVLSSPDKYSPRDRKRF